MGNSDVSSYAISPSTASPEDRIAPRISTCSIKALRTGDMGETSTLAQGAGPFSGVDTVALSDRKWRAASVAPGWIWAFLIGWMGGSQLLLWRFLDIAAPWAYALGGTLLAGLCF